MVAPTPPRGRRAVMLFIVMNLDVVSTYHADCPFRFRVGTSLFGRRGYSVRSFSTNPEVVGAQGGDQAVDHADLSVNDVWEEHYKYYISQSTDTDDDESYRIPSTSYISRLVYEMDENDWDAFITEQQQTWAQPLIRAYDDNIGSPSTQQLPAAKTPDTYIDEPNRHLRLLRRRLPDPLWSQIRLEAQHALSLEPDAGPQLYQSVLRHSSLIDALASIICHEIETELMPATALRALILEQLRLSDDKNIHLDLVASVIRKPSEDSSALNALLFHHGLHALVCYRVAHRLWLAGRTGLAYYMQSTVSSKYAADIHPAAEMEGGIYLNVGGGVVIGETARIGRHVTILQGVTLGGTGKETGDRHPKVEEGVILHCGATVLGNIRVGKGAVVTAKSIVTKEVPDLARVSGVPATVKSYREAKEGSPNNTNVECELDDLDCRMRLLYDNYFSALDGLVDTELCIDHGDDDCMNPFIADDK